MTTYLSSKPSIAYSFSNHQLAIVVRQHLITKLIPFDKNKDGLFDQIQISNVIHQLFEQSIEKSKQLYKQALRYDSNKDFKLTYEEMTNFCLEIYFGEIIVKHLDSKELYSQGGKRIMNQEQFVRTLEACLNLIKIKAQDQQLKKLYESVDKNKRGYIAYEQYFQFLAQYFGKQSKAAKAFIIPNAHQQISSMKHKHVSLNDLQQKIAKLVFSQLRVSLMKYDLSRSISFTRQEIRLLLAQVFGFIKSQQQQFLKANFSVGDSMRYQDVAREAVLFYICDLYFRGEHRDIVSIKSQHFVQMVKKAFFFVKVAPSPYDLQLLFMKTDTDCDNRISRVQYVQMMQNLIRGYKFNIISIKK